MVIWAISVVPASLPIRGLQPWMFKKRHTADKAETIENGCGMG